jgi:hypothetical protein
VIVVDASCLFEVLIDMPRFELIRQRLAFEPDHAASHVVDIELFSLIRRDQFAGRIDNTLAELAIEDLRS